MADTALMAENALASVPMLRVRTLTALKREQTGWRSYIDDTSPAT
jgi:hypothetical protein